MTNNSLEHYNSKFKSNFQKNINITKIIDILLNEVLNPDNYIIKENLMPQKAIPKNKLK